MSNDKMREAFGAAETECAERGYDLDHDSFVVGYQVALTQQPESEPAGYVPDYFENMPDGDQCEIAKMRRHQFTRPVYLSPQPTPQVSDIGLLPRWELNLSQGGIDEDDGGQFVRFDDLEELLSASPSIAEKQEPEPPEEDGAAW